VVRRSFGKSGSRALRESTLERLPLPRQPAFEALGAVTIAARPQLFAACIAASAAGVGVFDLQEFEIFLPIGSFFGQRGGAEAHLNPLDPAIRQLSRVRHITQVLIASDGAVAERALVNGAL
jgi:hypothetical protein